MTREKKEPKERILLFNHWQRREEISKILRDTAEVANNTVIPMCNELGMAVTLPNVLKWVNDKDAFRDAFISKCKREAASIGKFLCDVVEKTAYDDFTNRLKWNPYPVIMPRTVGESEKKLLSIKNGKMVYDEDELTEYTNVYLTDQDQIEVYHRIEELCKALDAFFGDKKPVNDALNSWASIVYPTKEGFKVNPRAEFKKLIIKKK